MHKAFRVMWLDSWGNQVPTHLFEKDYRKKSDALADIQARGDRTATYVLKTVYKFF